MQNDWHVYFQNCQGYVTNKFHHKPFVFHIMWAEALPSAHMMQSSVQKYVCGQFKTWMILEMYIWKPISKLQVVDQSQMWLTYQNLNFDHFFAVRLGDINGIMMWETTCA